MINAMLVLLVKVRNDQMAFKVPGRLILACNCSSFAIVAPSWACHKARRLTTVVIMRMNTTVKMVVSCFGQYLFSVCGRGTRLMIESDEIDCQIMHFIYPWAIVLFVQ